LEFCFNYFIKFLKHIIKEIKNPDFLNNLTITETLKNVLINLNIYIKMEIEDASYQNLKEITSDLIYEISQKFFNHNNLITHMFIAHHDFEEKYQREHIMFSMVLNLFLNETSFMERKSKKNVRLN
jgi:hypothetical protein